MQDAAILKCKCLIQHALALHLGDRHDEALVCLDEISSPELRSDTQDLRFCALLAVRKPLCTCDEPATFSAHYVS